MLFAGGLRGYIFFVQTKYLIIDPLSDDTMIFIWSANFSAPSLLSDDENMMLIRSDKLVANIYQTEFAQLFRHFWASTNR